MRRARTPMGRRKDADRSDKDADRSDEGAVRSQEKAGGSEKDADDGADGSGWVGQGRR